MRQYQIKRNQLRRKKNLTKGKKRRTGYKKHYYKLISKNRKLKTSSKNSDAPIAKKMQER
jgi:hypothetical protein